MHPKEPKVQPKAPKVQPKAPKVHPKEKVKPKKKWVATLIVTLRFVATTQT